MSSPRPKLRRWPLRLFFLGCLTLSMTAGRGVDALQPLAADDLLLVMQMLTGTLMRY